MNGSDRKGQHISNFSLQTGVTLLFTVATAQSNSTDWRGGHSEHKGLQGFLFRSVQKSLDVCPFFRLRVQAPLQHWLLTLPKGNSLMVWSCTPVPTQSHVFPPAWAVGGSLFEMKFAISASNSSCQQSSGAWNSQVISYHTSWNLWHPHAIPGDLPPNQLGLFPPMVRPAFHHRHGGPLSTEQKPPWALPPTVVSTPLGQSRGFPGSAGG